ncbi:MAG: D-inositol 3-phosphate glycosyltransferase [Pseudomonadota bacterium]
MAAQSSQLAETLPAVSTPPRILIDGRKLGDGGIGVYISNLVEGLVALGDASVTVLSRREREAMLACRNSVEWIFDDAKSYSLDEYLFMPRRVDFSRYDIFHAPHYSLPFRIPIPTVVTIHDLIHIKHPEHFFYPLIARPLIGSAVARASAVIAVSRDTREQVIAETSVVASKVRYIPNAIAPFLSVPETVTHEQEGGAATEAYFLAVISNTKPHKGVEDLLKAYRSFAERHQRVKRMEPLPTLKLVGFGADRVMREGLFQSTLAELKGVEILGAVDAKVLRSLYHGAKALVVPSIAEGFCLPALEAQSVGTSVVCRPVPAIEELLTERDIVADDLSVRALEMALHEAAARERGSSETIAAHLARFSLEAVATQTLAVYRDVLSQGASR